MDCQNICSVRKSPTKFFLNLIAIIVLFYSLWFQNIKGILIAVLIILIGQIIQSISEQRKKNKPIKKKIVVKKKKKR